MVASLETARRYCAVSPAEAALLASPQSPVVLLERLPGSPVVPGVAPGQRSLGLMLPYTPLHALLFADLGPSSPPPEVLVMTSGNLSEEPIVTDNDEARLRLASLADAFLLHDRPIHIRCDDSVVRLVEFDGGAPAELLIRRSRGYAPFPVRLPFDVPPLLAAGAELKNTFCLGRGQYAFLSHHIGDLENYETLQSFEQGIAHFERLFRIQPQAIACDLHPGYLATAFAQELACRENLPLTGVQHHHAHIAACMAENGLPLDAQVIGLSFDGTGYGTDGAVWGGEFLLAGYAAFERRYHFAYLPLPGGDRAIREPWRMALAWLTTANLEWQPGLPPVDYALGLEGGAVRLEALRRQLETGLNSPPTSSLGRLFDAAAALLGVRQVASYEAQAAIELEALADPAETGRYPAFELDQTLLPSAPVPPGQPAGPLPIGTSALLAALLADLRLGAPLPIISARFHNSLAHLALQVCRQLRQETGRQQVALSGGVWQNTFLLQRAVRLLTQDGFTPRVHRQVPPNDGGLSLGQLAIAAARLADPTPQA